MFYLWTMSLTFFASVIFLNSILQYSIQKIFIYYKRFDDINHRSSHNTFATRTGGIGIFLTLLIISLFYYFQSIEIFDYSLFIPLSIMFIIGVYDDFYNADFKLKFLLQIIVAKILIDQGYVISNYYGLFGLYEIPWLLAQLTTIFIFLIVVNAINFIDGIDGLAISEVIKIVLFIELFSMTYTPLLNLGILIIFSLMPLYYFNFKKNNKIFLGDGGSMLLGTVVMIYILFLLGNEYYIKNEFKINKTLFAILVLIYPLIDLLRVFILRIKDGKSPFVADQRHLHHILHKKGIPTILNVSIIQTTCILLLLAVTLFV